MTDAVTETRFRCSDAARDRDDPMAGTAAPTRSWLLVEHLGRWPANSFNGLDVAELTKISIGGFVAATGTRVLLVRRPGKRDTERPRQWAYLSHDEHGEHRQLWGTWDRDEDLAEVPERVRDDPGSTGLPPVLLVCAHALHDVCCAVRGRPVAAALAHHWPEQTWECSHVGGDRFAGNMVVAPDGVYYGGLDADNAVGVVRDHLADRIGADHLRGWTTLGSPQQVAVAAVLREYGPAGRHDLQVVHSHLDDNRWRIELAGHGPLPSKLLVELVTTRSDRRLHTCRADLPSAVFEHWVVSVSPAG